MKHSYYTYQELSPLSFKGHFILILSLILLYEFAVKEKDFIALILSSAFLGILSILFIVTFIYYLLLITKNNHFAFKIDFHEITIMQEAHYSIITNISFFIPLTKLVISIQGVRLNDKPPCININHVIDKAEALIHDSLIFSQRGEYKIQYIKIYVQDVFGFTRFQFSKPIGESLIVYPKIKSQNIYIDPISTTVEDNQDSSHSYLDGDYYEHREYRTGDDTRRLNWKLTAKTGKLILRTPEKVYGSFQNTYLYLSNCTPYIKESQSKNFQDLLDQIVIDCLSFSISQIKNGNQVFFGSDTYNNSKTIVSQLKEIQFELATTSWIPNEHFYSSLSQFIKKVKEIHFDAKEFVIFMPLLSENWADPLAQIAKQENISINLFTYRLTESILSQSKKKDLFFSLNWNKFIFTRSTDYNFKNKLVQPNYKLLSTKSKAFFRSYEEQLLFKISQKLNPNGITGIRKIKIFNNSSIK